MINNLSQLDNQLEGLSEKTGFSDTDLLIYPESFRPVHSYKLFGNDLHAN